MIMAAGVIAALFGVVGLIEASQATFGVALIGFACLVGILARLDQAERHHKASR